MADPRKYHNLKRQTRTYTMHSNGFMGYVSIIIDEYSRVFFYPFAHITNSEILCNSIKTLTPNNKV